MYLKRCAVSSLPMMCVSPLSLLAVALCVRFVAVRRFAETRRAWQQQQTNANAVVKSALQAQQKETTRRAGDYKGGSRNAEYYSAVVLCTKVYNSGIISTPVRVLKKIHQSCVKMSNFQSHSPSLQCTYATLLRLHSRQRCCSRGRKDGC